MGGERWSLKPELEETILGAVAGLFMLAGAWFFDNQSKSKLQQASFFDQLPTYSVKHIAQLLATSTLGDYIRDSRGRALITCAVNGLTACPYETITYTRDEKTPAVFSDIIHYNMYSTTRRVNKHRPKDKPEYREDIHYEKVNVEKFGNDHVHVIDVTDVNYLDKYLLTLKRCNDKVFDRILTKNEENMKQKKDKAKEKKKQQKQQKQQKLQQQPLASPHLDNLPSAPSGSSIDEVSKSKSSDQPPSYAEILQGDRRDVDLVAGEILAHEEHRNDESGSDSDDDDDRMGIPEFPKPSFKLPRSLIPSDLIVNCNPVINYRNISEVNVVNNNYQNITNINNNNDYSQNINSNNTYNNSNNISNNNSNSTPNHSQQSPSHQTININNNNNYHNNNNNRGGDQGKNAGNDERNEEFIETNPNVDKPRLTGDKSQEKYLPLKQDVCMIATVYRDDDDNSLRLSTIYNIHNGEKYDPVVSSQTKQQIVDELYNGSIILHHSSIGLTILGAIAILAPPLLHLFR
jgi:hypothetical protein